MPSTIHRRPSNPTSTLGPRLPCLSTARSARRLRARPATARDGENVQSAPHPAGLWGSGATAGPQNALDDGGPRKGSIERRFGRAQGPLAVQRGSRVVQPPDRAPCRCGLGDAADSSAIEPRSLPSLIRASLDAASLRTLRTECPGGRVLRPGAGLGDLGVRASRARRIDGIPMATNHNPQQSQAYGARAIARRCLDRAQWVG